MWEETRAAIADQLRARLAGSPKVTVEMLTPMFAAFGELDEVIVAKDEDAYVEIAAGLARDRERLTDIRKSLRARMAASRLCDAAAFARGVESAYRRMWREWCLAS